MEHRGSPRIAADLRVELRKIDGSRQVARIKNISNLGIFLAATPDDFRLYESLEIVAVTDSKYQLRGRIVRKQENGIAIELDADGKTLSRASQLVRSLKQSGSAVAPHTAAKLVNQ